MGMHRSWTARLKPRMKAGTSIVPANGEIPCGQCMRSAVQKRFASSGESQMTLKLAGIARGCCCATISSPYSGYKRSMEGSCGHSRRLYCNGSVNRKRVMNVIAQLTELGKDDVGLAGGKGANLGELIRAGVRVPTGFVVKA